MIFKYVTSSPAMQKKERKVNKHRSFISAQFSSFGEQTILNGNHPKHPK
jgi:hypothetical protein